MQKMNLTKKPAEGFLLKYFEKVSVKLPDTPKDFLSCRVDAKEDVEDHRFLLPNLDSGVK